MGDVREEGEAEVCACRVAGEDYGGGRDVEGVEEVEEEGGGLLELPRVLGCGCEI